MEFDSVQSLKNFLDNNRDNIEIHYVVSHYPNGMFKSRAPFLSGLRHGQEKKYWRCGTISEIINCDNGKLVKYESYYETGIKCEEVNYVDGKAEGVCLKWYENGALFREENYVNGRPNGITTVWYDTGQKIRTILYKDGIIIKKEGR